jgi:putative transposase
MITLNIRNKFEDFTFAWQKSFFDKIIRNDEQLEKTRKYILNNPLKWELDVNNPVNIK